jgi:hypothetical protein
MKKLSSAILLALLASTAQAKDKALPLPESAIPNLAGKTVAVVRHARPDFVAMTAGKAAFGLVGAGAMVAAGNEIVSRNNIEDPAAVLERELAPVFAKKYGMEIKPAPAYALTQKQKKPAEIAALEQGVDYVLDIRSGGWMSLYYPTDWNNYWVMYSVQVQLIDTKTSTLVSNLACIMNSKADKHPPKREELLENGAQLLKDVTQGFGWGCASLIGREQFHLAEGELAPIPAQFVDVLGQYAHVKHGAPLAPGAVVAPVANAAQEDAPVADTTEPTTEPTTEAGEPATGAAPSEAAAPAPAPSP